MESITVNTEQRLYVIPMGGNMNALGYGCLGFDVTERKRLALATHMQLPLANVAVGTVEHYADYSRLCVAASLEFARTGKRLESELSPQLKGLEGKTVTVVDHDGERRRFTVGKSTGWWPCHLELSTRRSSGGCAADSRGYQSVTVVR